MFAIFQDYLPSNKSAVLVEDFQDIEDLASYIQLLDSNDRLYLQYLQYKDQPITNQYLENLLRHRNWQPPSCAKPLKTHKNGGGKSEMETFGSLFTGYECFVCDLVTQLRKETVTPVGQHVANDSHYGCPSPRQFDENGRYSVKHDDWSREWREGKYEAQVLDDLHREQKTVTEKQFKELVREAEVEDKSTALMI